MATDPYGPDVQAAMEAPAQAIPFTGLTGSAQLAGGPWLLYALVLGNSAASGGHVIVHDGTDASGAPLLEFTIGATTYASPSLAAPVLAQIGLFLEVSAGLTVQGSAIATRVITA